MTPLTSLAGSIGAVGLIAALTPSAPDVGAGVGEDPCKVVDVEYALAATLQLVDTPLGKGDGNYTIGPGTVVLRFDRRVESSPPRAKMIEYRMQEHFTIQTTALFWSATVVTATSTHATPDSCEDVADGVLADRKLLWSSPVRGYATDGELTCEGSLCGKFGAPPRRALPLPRRAAPGAVLVVRVRRGQQDVHDALHAGLEDRVAEADGVRRARWARGASLVRLGVSMSVGAAARQRPTKRPARREPAKTKKARPSYGARFLRVCGADGTRTRGLRRDRPAL